MTLKNLGIAKLQRHLSNLFGRRTRGDWHHLWTQYNVEGNCGFSTRSIRIFYLKYKNNKIQKYNYEMFCGWSELTQVWPPGDKKYKRNYQNKKYLKSKITKILTIQLRDVLWLVWADSGLTTRWLEWPGSKSAAATKIPNHLPHSKLKLLNFLGFQIASNFSDILLIFLWY